MNFHSEEEAGLVVRAEEMLGCKLYPVHRLDKMTSGLVILAKSSETAAIFNELFSERKIEKYYLAVSLRKPKKKQGWVKGDMLQARRGSWKLATTMENPAITRFISASLRPHERLFLVKPFTGKTHQIRVALKAVGAPIAGDVRYANADEARKEDRGYLHAYALRFDLDGEAYCFVQPPEEGERFLSETAQKQFEQWQKPWELFNS
jgi:tRNA pseudouridine32 synthase/23S rRNA pseudouridine746 synthase